MIYCKKSKTMKYFRLLDDLNIPNRWFLSSFHLNDSFNIWGFTKAGPTTKDYDGLCIGVSGDIALDFTFADFAVPVINDRTAYFLPNSEIQLIKVKANKLNNLNVLILLHELDCLDEEKSIFKKFDENSSRPDLVGHYRAIYKLFLDKEKCLGYSIFKIKGFVPGIIVSEEVKDLFINNYVRGVLFEEI